MKDYDTAPACKNIFRDGKDSPSPERYTQIWIALINQMERNKQVGEGKQNGGSL